MTNSVPEILSPVVIGGRSPSKLATTAVMLSSPLRRTARSEQPLRAAKGTRRRRRLSDSARETGDPYERRPCCGCGFKSLLPLDENLDGLSVDPRADVEDISGPARRAAVSGAQGVVRAVGPCFSSYTVTPLCQPVGAPTKPGGW
jgi:hypothetical protein